MIKPSARGYRPSAARPSSAARARRAARPWRPEGVLIRIVVRDLLPAGEEVDGLRDVGIPHRLRRRRARLDITAPQAGDRRAQGAVDLERQEIVAANPRAPRAVDMRDDVPVE